MYFYPDIAEMFNNIFFVFFESKIGYDFLGQMRLIAFIGDALFTISLKKKFEGRVHKVYVSIVDQD